MSNLTYHSILHSKVHLGSNFVAGKLHVGRKDHPNGRADESHDVYGGLHDMDGEGHVGSGDPHGMN